MIGSFEFLARPISPKWMSSLCYPRTNPLSRDHSAGHIVGQIGRQELDHLGAILDCPEPPKRDQFGPITVALNAARNDRRHDPPGREHAGRETVGRDSERADTVISSA